MEVVVLVDRAVQCPCANEQLRLEADKRQLQSIIDNKDRSIESLERDLKICNKALVDGTAKAREQTTGMESARQERSSPALDMLFSVAAT